MEFQNPEELAEYVFSEFVSDKNSPLEKKELVQIFNAAFEEAGVTVSQDDIDEALGRIETENDETLTKSEFTKLAKEVMEKVLSVKFN